MCGCLVVGRGGVGGRWGFSESERNVWRTLSALPAAAALWLHWALLEALQHGKLADMLTLPGF